MGVMRAEPQYDKTPREYLEEADRQFDAGNKREGSKRVWQAVQTAIAAVAAQRGLSCLDDDDVFRLVVALDKEDGNTRQQIGSYGVAEGFRDNSREVWEEDNYDLSLYHWDEDGFEMARPIAVEFVEYLVKKVEKDAKRQ